MCVFHSLIQGEKSFFLLPGEKLEQGIQDVFILGEDEGLILKANEAFVDVDEKEVNMSCKYVTLQIILLFNALQSVETLTLPF